MLFDFFCGFKIAPLSKRGPQQEQKAHLSGKLPEASPDKIGSRKRTEHWRGLNRQKKQRKITKITFFYDFQMFFLFFHGFSLVFPWIFVREGFPQISSKYLPNPPKSIPYKFSLIWPLIEEIRDWGKASQGSHKKEDRGWFIGSRIPMSGSFLTRWFIWPFKWLLEASKRLLGGLIRICDKTCVQQPSLKPPPLVFLSFCFFVFLSLS